MDGLIGALESPCRYKKFGCGISIAYQELAEHMAACAHAPCHCHECTPPFEGSPASLVRHFTDKSGRHRWPRMRSSTGQRSGS
jgi:E3 ubiquitin-protein ligase SIAH1